MALFASYLDAAETERSDSPSLLNLSQPASSSWLSNVSFQPVVAEAVEKRKLSRNEKKRLSRKKKKEKEKKEERKRKEDRKARAPSSAFPRKARFHFVPDCRSGAEFAEDKFYDIENLIYDSFYSKETASYTYLSGIVHCLGCSAQAHSLCAVIHSGKYWSDILSKRYFKRKKKKGSSALVNCQYNEQAPNVDEKVILEDFVPVETTITDESGAKCKYDFALKMYRPIDSDSNENPSVDLADYSGNVMFAGAIQNAEHRHLSQELNSSPDNVKLWLRLLALEDELYDLSQTKAFRSQSVSRMAFLERKQSIVDKAIQSCPRIVELHLARLEILREMSWSKADLQKEWRALEFTFVNRSEIWIERLRHNLLAFRDFTVAQQLSIFDSSLEKSFVVLSGQLVTHRPLADTAVHLMNCLLGKIVFLRESGHYERAVRTVQALLELMFSVPGSGVDTPSLSAKRQMLEARWADTFLHFGEFGWKSWSKAAGCEEDLPKSSPFSENVTKHLDDQARQEEDTLCSESVNLSLKDFWQKLEHSREKFHWFPFPESEEAECEDTERVVLFEDIEPGLYDLSTPVEKCWFLVEALKALRLASFPPFQSSNRQDWYEERDIDYYLDEFTSLPRPHVPWQSMSSKEEVFTLFCDHSCQFLPAFPWSLYLSSSQIFSKSRSLLRNNDLSSKGRLKVFRTYCKSIMSDCKLRNSVLLYAVYIQSLASLEAREEARQTAYSILTTLDSRWYSQPYGSPEQIAPLMLASSYAKFCFEAVESPSFYEDALRVLACFLSDGKVSASCGQPSVEEIRDLKNALSSRMELQFEQLYTADLQDSSDWYFRLGWLGSPYVMLLHILALLTYATEGIRSCFDIYRRGREKVRSVVGALQLDQKSQSRHIWALDREVERLWEWEIDLLRLNMLNKKRKYDLPPSVLLNSVSDALKEFPNHVGFLRLFCSVQLKNSLMVQLRRSLGVTQSKCSVARFVAAIFAEFCYFVKLRDTEMCHADPSLLYNVFDLAANAQQHSVVLWRLRLAFEGLLCQSGVDKRQDVAYRALQSCPWSKSLFDDAVQCFPAEKTQVVVDLMVEKGLRLRVPWEELLLLSKASAQQESD
ncbi:inositol polyphosphate 5 phosphatase [Trichuris trichiura]|uniref:Inositol polyphosphate 5 phosphatase n=1 Tax=Trichuris trichiura TaxID=36087 RepID=A0A077ZE81_TRITR|nr:inositol polyphosphate 5 phosphatase [Trichuris trichiura]